MRFICYLPDIDADLRLYWDEHESWVCPWYLKQQRPDDLVISASPEFVVKPMTDRLGIRLIATSMDKHTAKIDGLNCHGEEKVRRFYKEFPEDTVVENFYSDSLTDTPLAKLADKAYLIRIAVSLDYLVRYPRERTVDRRAVHDIGLELHLLTPKHKKIRSCRTDKIAQKHADIPYPH